MTKRVIGMIGQLLKTTICIMVILPIYSCTTTSSKKTKASYYNIGNQYARDGLLREAITAYRKELAINPKNHMAIRNLGIVYVKTRDYKKAIYYLKSSLPKYPNNYDVNYFLGEAYRACERYEDAIYRYRKSLDTRKNSVKSAKALAWSYYKTHNYRGALKIINRLMKGGKNDIQLAIIATRIYIKLGQLNDAFTLISKTQAIAKKADLPYLHSVEGDLLYAKGEYNEAGIVYRKALKEQPLLAGALLGLGKCLLQKNAKIYLAISYFERALRLKPNLVEGLYFLGKIYENKDPKKSFRYYKLFIRRARGDPEYASFRNLVKNKIANWKVKR